VFAEVGSGSGIVSLALDRYDVKRRVELTVPPSVETVASIEPGGCGDWSDTSKHGEGGFVANTAGV
jgi:hypothetical protein